MFCFDKSFVFSTFGPLFIFPPTPGLAKLPLKKKTWLRLNSKACRGRQRFNWGFIWTTLNVAQCNTRTCTPTVFAFLPSGLFEDLQCWKLLSSCLDECLLICVECVCAQQSGVMSALSTHVWMLFFLPFFLVKARLRLNGGPCVFSRVTACSHNLLQIALWDGTQDELNWIYMNSITCFLSACNYNARSIIKNRA